MGAAWMMEEVSWMGGSGAGLDAEADTMETRSDTCITHTRSLEALDFEMSIFVSFVSFCQQVNRFSIFWCSVGH